MDPSPNPAFTAFRGTVTEGFKFPGHIRHRVVGDFKGNIFRLKKAGKNFQGCAAESAVSADIFRVVRSVQERRPCRNRFGERVVIFVRTVNGRDGAPEFVMELGVPAGNRAIAQGDVELTQQPCNLRTGVRSGF